MLRSDLLTIYIHEAGADPDNLAVLQDLGLADYQELGFPPQGLATTLSRNGLITRKGKNKDERTLWAPGPYHDRWLEHYKKHRIAFRTSRKLPLELDPKIITRMIIRAGCDPDDFLYLTVKHASDLGDMKKQVQALMGMGLLQPIPETGLLGPGRYYESWARAYPGHRDQLRKIYRLPDRPVPEAAGEAMA